MACKTTKQQTKTKIIRTHTETHRHTDTHTKKKKKKNTNKQTNKKTQVKINYQRSEKRRLKHMKGWGWGFGGFLRDGTNSANFRGRLPFQATALLQTNGERNEIT